MNGQAVLSETNKHNEHRNSARLQNPFFSANERSTGTMNGHSKWLRDRTGLQRKAVEKQQTDNLARTVLAFRLSYGLM